MDKNGESRIYVILDAMDEYLSTCRPKFMSNTDITVNRETLEGFIRDLRRETPDEVEFARSVIHNQEAILNDARIKAQGLIDNAVAETDNLVSQNEIIRRAHEQAEQIIMMAQQQAQDVVDGASMEANALRSAATGYMEDVMNYLENIFDTSSQSAAREYTNLINMLNQYGDKVRADHRQIHPEEAAPETTEVLPSEE